MSLVEMAVVLLILSAVLAIVFGVLTSVETDEVAVSSRYAAAGQGQVIAQSLSRQVHAAATPTGMTSPFVLATANQLELYSALGNADGPTQLDIQAVAACSGCTDYNLVEDVVQPTLVSGLPTYTGAAQQVLLGTGLSLPAPDPTSDCGSGSAFVPGIFEYFTTTGSCLALGSQSPPALETAQLTSVENITITITTVDPQRPASSPQAVVTLEVSLPNVDYSGA